MSTELILVGAGLANSLIALRLRALRPEISLLLVDRDLLLGGHHTWSFHESDLDPSQHAWVRPLVACAWPRHEVRFPAYVRRIERGYHSITAEQLRRVVHESLGDRLRLGAEVSALSPTEVTLADGTRLAARGVIDGRGNPGGSHLQLGFQKFVGRTLRLEGPHGLDGPVLMDATVPQEDGFRFIYTLPFAQRLVMVEDTRYSDTPELDRGTLRKGIDAYVHAQGWHVEGVSDEEEGALPIVLSGDIEAFWESSHPGVPRSGLRAALFHPTTGYSLPEAVRLADEIAASRDLSGAALYALTRHRSREVWRRGGFFRLLNRMLFRAAVPGERYRVLERFYRLREPLLARFYAGRVTWHDRLRVLSGRPPVPLWRAFGAAFGPWSRGRERKRAE